MAHFIGGTPMASTARCPREWAEALEPEFLNKDLATRSTDLPAAKREHSQEPDKFRTEFDRDYTRILHSRAFRRLRHKPQVFIDPLNDHICTRLEHSLLVASVSRTISKALGLNNELVAAIAVGHDLGHAPFGHEGERCLGKLAEGVGLGFKHEPHSLRVVDRLERMYKAHPGLNLTFAVRDGIACHCGEKIDQRLSPDRKKQPASLKRPKVGMRPATLEGCVVRFADVVAYLGRDLEDAMMLDVGIVTKKQIPSVVKRVLGDDNRSIMGSLIGDIVANSKGKGDCIAMSDRKMKALLALMDFNNEAIYKSPKVKERFKQISKAMGFMFEEIVALITDAKKKGVDDGELFADRRDKENWVTVLSSFLTEDIQDWWREKPAQLTVDFIAGMTDAFFIRAFQEMFLPYGTV